MDSGFKRANRFPVSMDTPGDDDYLPLATAAELPILRKQAILHAYKEAEKRYLEDESDANRKELIAHNSGLRAVEYELSFVVNELSICNLCAQAQKQLEGVLRSVQEGTEKISEEIKRQEDSKVTHLEEKYQAIVHGLFDDPLSVMNKAIGSIEGVMDVNKDMKKSEDTLIRDAINGITSEINRRWREIKQNPQLTMQQIIMNNPFVKEIRDRRNSLAKSYCDEKFEKFQNDCVSVVYESKNLSDEEQHMLERCMKQWSAVPFSASEIAIDKEKISKQFLIFFRKPDKKKCCYEAEKSLMNVLGHQLDLINEAVGNSIRQSCTRTRELFLADEKIKAVNPELKALAEQIDMLKIQKEDYIEFQKRITSKLGTVSHLTQLQQKGTV